MTLEPLLVRHAQARALLAVGVSNYWKLAREGKIKILGRGRAGRADYSSLVAYVRSLPADQGGTPAPLKAAAAERAARGMPPGRGRRPGRPPIKEQPSAG